jgi:hypothetical protein
MVMPLFSDTFYSPLPEHPAACWSEAEINGAGVGPRQHIEDTLYQVPKGLDFSLISPFLPPKTSL